MQRFISIFGLCTVLFVTGCRAQPAFPYMYPYPKAKFTLHVVNQDGIPIEDAEIEANFSYCNHDLCKRTDENGYVTFESGAVTDVLFTNRRYKTWRTPNVIDHYYATLIHKEFHTPSKNTKDGKWQPWNPIIEMVLKERINPIPMYATSRWNELKIPLLNTWCGFDMTVNDWVSPHGSGSHADIEIYYQWDGFDGKDYHGSTLEIRFPDEKAGYYTFQYPCNKNGRSQHSFISPYHAEPSNTFNPKMSFSDIIVLKKEPVGDRVFQCIRSNHMKRGTGYIFRTRTRFDENGNLIGAHYGKIYPTPDALFRRSRKGNAFISLRYYLNPTENDTNLEYDPKKNLFMEKVKPSEHWKYRDLAP